MTETKISGSGSPDDVRLNWKAIRRHLDRREWAGAHLLAKLTPATPALVSALETAVETANEASARNPDSEQVWAGGVLESPRGPIIPVDRVVDGPEMLEWLETFTAHLNRSGLEGEITAAPITWLPQAAQDTGARRNVWAFATFRPSAQPPEASWSWSRSAEEGHRLASSIARWADGDKADLYVDMTAPIRYKGTEAEGFLYRYMTQGFGPGLVWVQRKPITWTRSVNVSLLGTATFGHTQEHLPWEEAVDATRALLVTSADVLNYAYIRSARGIVRYWVDAHETRDEPAFPRIPGSMLRSNIHMFGRYALDAHGVQVLTAHHLDRAYDLHAWTTRALGHDRYLVEARDLAAWFTGDQLDPDLLAQARQDFGDMLLTVEDLIADPHAYVIERLDPNRTVGNPSPVDLGWQTARESSRLGHPS